MNCIIIDDDQVIRKLLEEFVNKTQEIHLIGSYENPLKALEDISANTSIDLIFLDIEMPEMTGLELLDNLNTNPRVIIISGKQEYALDAFNYDVTDYLLKPITYGRFYKAVSRALEKHSKQEAPPKEASKDEIFIRDGSTLTRIRFSDIVFAEAQENYISLTEYENSYLIHFTMKALEKQLPPERFIRIHRSYFVNIEKIHQIIGNMVEVNLKKGKKRLPIGKSYKENLMKQLNLMN